MKMRNRVTAFCLFVLMICFLVVSGCVAESGLGQEEIVLADVEIRKSNEQLLEEYVREQMYSIGGKLSNRMEAGKTLPPREQRMYDMLLADIKKVASGERTSTIFTYSVEEIFEKTKYTADEFGIDSFIDQNGQLADVVTEEILPIQTRLVLNALLLQNPYELYWFDKSYGIGVSPYPVEKTISVDGRELYLVGKIKVMFPVSVDYAKDGKSNECDPKYGSSVKAAVSNAQRILDKYQGKSDKERILGYAKEIFNLSSYNHEAAYSKTMPYGNPWQLVWVFDGDESTTVVCEGFSKAFQYLCDLSSFTGNIQVITVTGRMNGELHMWNVVRMNDGINYLMDVTNSESGYLVLAKCDSGNYLDGHVIVAGPTLFYYNYDFDTLNRYKPEDLMLGKNQSTQGVDIDMYHFPDSYFMEYVTQFDTDGNGHLSEAEINGVTLIDIRQRNIVTAIGIEFFTELKYLYCTNNQLSSLNTSDNTKLEILDCSNNRLTTLDVGGNANLEELTCDHNQIGELNLQNNTALENLKCNNNRLSALDLNKNANLVYCTCEGNALKKLTISDNGTLSALVQNVEREFDGTRDVWMQTDVDRPTYISLLSTDPNVIVKAGNYISEPMTEAERKIRAFVTRCYQVILGRNPDAGGLEIWMNELSSGRKAAAEIIEQFVVSAEFQNKKLSNEDAVEVLYKAMLGRGADPAGKADWVEKLNNGQPLTAVISGFCGSAEFKAVCDSYGINPGTVTVQENRGTDNEKIKAFVARCYQIILGREADEGGMNTWFNELQSGRKAASEIIDSFVRSQEFQNKNYSKADSVEILYKAMLGRPSDAAGKADWVSKLEAGQPLAAVINGFCGSAEFKAICDSYGITPGSVNVIEQPAPAADDEKIRAFVARCYKIILGRDADEGGMNTWANELKSQRKAAAEIIQSFVYSQEFQNKRYSNPDAVEILYKAMLGRGSDAAGKADWVEKLNNGQPLTAVINGFCGSVEFKTICDAYGIMPGSVQVQQMSTQEVVQAEPMEAVVKKSETKANLVEITNPSDTVNDQLGTAVQAIYINEEKAKEFIGRCYRSILGREAGEEELGGWIKQMINGSKTADQIARGFLFSDEFKARSIGNEELVKILYRVYLNREADPEGLATWTQKLDEGTGLNDLLNVFAKTNEFKAVLRNMAE